MFGLGFGEIVIIAILALLLLGPDRLPDAAKALGKGLREIRKATDDLKDQVDREINLKEILDDKKPSLVQPVPARPLPGPSGPPPAATAENVPGLEAALVESLTVAEEYSAPAVPAPPAEPAAPTAPARAVEPSSSAEPSPASAGAPPSAQNP